MIVLDTHALVWWVTGDPALSKNAQAAIEQELTDGEIIISSISAWEIALLVQRAKLVLAIDVTRWLAVVATIASVRFMPVDNDIALQSVDLPGQFHKDPADRIIVATARQLGAPLVTKDEKILTYPHVKTIW